MGRPTEAFRELLRLAVRRVNGRFQENCNLWVACCFWPGQRPLTPTGAGHSLYFGLLGHFQGVIDLDAEITNRTLQLRVS